MKLTYRRLSAEDVLAVLNEDYRQNCVNGLALPGETLTLDMTVDEWHEAIDANFWRYDQVGLHLNWLFDTKFPEASWREVLLPYRRTRLRGVCELIASQAVVAEIRPARILGRECLAAGAFMTIRERLSEAGDDVSDLRPSTSLSDFVLREGEHVYCELVRLAPRKLPEMKCVKSAGTAVGHALFLVGLLVVAPCAIAILAFTLGVLMAIAIAAVARLGLWALPDWEWTPKRGEFGEMTTFRDLSVALAAS